jgi:hypothetical protein
MLSKQEEDVRESLQVSTMKKSGRGKEFFAAAER